MSWDEAMKLAIESARIFKRRYRVFAMESIFNGKRVWGVRRAA